MNIKIKSVYVKDKKIYFTKDFKDLKHFLIVEYQNELNRYVEYKKSTKLQNFYKSYLIDTHKVNIILLGYRLTLIKTYIKCVQRSYTSILDRRTCVFRMELSIKKILTK